MGKSLIITGGNFKYPLNPYILDISQINKRDIGVSITQWEFYLPSLYIQKIKILPADLFDLNTGNIIDNIYSIIYDIDIYKNNKCILSLSQNSLENSLDLNLNTQFDSTKDYAHIKIYSKSSESIPSNLRINILQLANTTTDLNNMFKNCYIKGMETTFGFFCLRGVYYYF